MRKYLLPICFPVLFALIISFVFAFQVSAFDKTDFEKAKDSNADLSGADLSRADLTQVKNLSIKQLSKVKTLYRADLDPKLMKQVEDKYLHLLEGPYE